MAIRVIDDTKLQNIAVAIQSKDNGGQMTVDEMAGRIENIPTGSDFDMTVTDNQVKMVIEVNDYDLSFWTRFGISGGGTVSVDWGDGTTDTYTENGFLEYAEQRKHNYQKAGRYLVTETVENGTLTIGSINSYSTLSEGKIDDYYNSGDTLRYMYNYKIKELAYGDSIVIYNGFMGIPYIRIYNDVNYYLINTSTDFITVKAGTTAIAEFQFNNTTAYVIKIPNSVTTISNRAFDSAKIKTIDFTSIRLNENNELPITFTSTNVFSSTSASMILLFATQEIAEVAKTTTNLSQLASRIKYVGEV